MRASNINQQRKLRFGQAVLLGVKFEEDWEFPRLKVECQPKRWTLKIPRALLEKTYLYASDPYHVGPFKRRWEAVDHALQLLGVS